MQWNKDLAKKCSYLEDFANLQSLVWGNEIWFQWKFSSLKICSLEFSFCSLEFFWYTKFLYYTKFVYFVPLRRSSFTWFLYDKVRLLFFVLLRWLSKNELNQKNRYIYQALLPSTVNLTMYSFSSIILFREWCLYFSFIHTS